jgi:hypothetical protein
MGFSTFSVVDQPACDPIGRPHSFWSTLTRRSNDVGSVVRCGCDTLPSCVGIDPAFTSTGSRLWASYRCRCRPVAVTSSRYLVSLRVLSPRAERCCSQHNRTRRFARWALPRVPLLRPLNRTDPLSTQVDPSCGPFVFSHETPRKGRSVLVEDGCCLCSDWFLLLRLSCLSRRYVAWSRRDRSCRDRSESGRSAGEWRQAVRPGSRL